MSITVHGEKSHVADIIGAAATEIVEQEYRAGKFALTDGILVKNNGREFVMTLLDYSITRGTWKTTIFLIDQGCPIVLDVEGVCDDEYVRFSTLGWAMIHEEGLFGDRHYDKRRDMARGLIRRRHAEIDVLKPCAIGFDIRQEAEEAMGTLWLGRGSISVAVHNIWPLDKRSWNALEFSILCQREPLLDVMLRVQAVPARVLWDFILLCRDRVNHMWAYEILAVHWTLAEQREKRALATAWACKAVPGNVWRDLAEILVHRLLADTFPYRTKMMDTKKRKNPPKKKKLKK